MQNKNLIYTILGVVFILAIPIVLTFFIFDNNSEPPTSPPTGEGERHDNGSDSDSNKGKESNSRSDKNGQNEKEIYWGVDSANYTDEGLFQCVKDNFGQPEVWGRYLGIKEDVSTGLDNDEVNYLHENNVRILVIYNHFTDATGYDHSVKEAKQAIEYAKELGIPDGVALFGDIEPKYPVDSEFIEGWYDTLSDSKYEPALYGVFDKESAILDAYNATKKETQENTIIWTAFPQGDITTKENAPNYKPKGPESSKLYGWQYAIEAEKCKIDTNLYKKEMLDYLW